MLINYRSSDCSCSYDIEVPCALDSDKVNQDDELHIHDKNDHVESYNDTFYFHLEALFPNKKPNGKVQNDSRNYTKKAEVIGIEELNKIPIITQKLIRRVLPCRFAK